MTPKVSVIMGIYNCGTTLDDAIQSLLNQTYQDFEIIMCDDGSNDNTYEIAKSYQNKCPDKIKVLKNDVNLGLNKTLNRCLRETRGEYIARMDGDDISLPTRIEKEVEFLDNNPEYAVVSMPMIYFDENGDWGRGNAIEYPKISDFKTHAPFFCHAPCMIRKTVYCKVGGYSEDPRTIRFEDCNLWYKIYAAGYKGYNIQEPLYKMRDDQNAKARRTFKSRMNAVYVSYIGFKMLKMPWYNYIYIIRVLIQSIILGIIPNKLYFFLHKSKKQTNMLL